MQNEITAALSFLKAKALVSLQWGVTSTTSVIHINTHTQAEPLTFIHIKQGLDSADVHTESREKLYCKCMQWDKKHGYS